MKINMILKNPEESLLYMERMVNNGSPSGFSFVNTTTKKTSPLHVKKFKVSKIIDLKEKFVTVGNLNNVKDNNIYDFVYVHPDWQLYDSLLNIEKADKIVVPTSSSRTVKDINSNYYIKMAYPGILGRITRELGLKHIYSSIDVSNILYDLISQDDAPNALAFLPEAGGKCYKNENYEIGYILRNSRPVGKNVHKIKAQIPAFSLFSIDKKSYDDPIIIQLLEKQNNIYKYLFEQLLFPIIDCYFYCVFKGGIHPEMHSQNFLLGIDDRYNICSVILRDLESIDKDITIMEKIKYFPNLMSFPYKCIWQEQFNYKIKHSFMYDHKLCEYFFDQLIKCLCKKKLVDKDLIQDTLKSYVVSKYGKKLYGFFPEDGYWYKFDSVVVDRNQDYRPYVRIPKPKYR